MHETDEDAIARLADELRRRGLATPALMLIDMATPLGFVGEQLLVALGPLLPSAAWRETATGLVATLRHEQSRDFLQHLLRE